MSITSNQGDFAKALRKQVNAFPRNISFPYGEEAFGLHEYSAVPKYGRKQAKFDCRSISN